MAKDSSLEHPWQKTPTQLIQYAQDLMNEESDFENQLAFLLIDVGVETMFITYLSLPNEVTGAITPYWERKKIIDKGSFHSLMTGVKEAAGELSDNIDFNQVLYFHNIRNKLYHLGDGIVATEENLQDYMEISKFILKELLDVDLLSFSLKEMVEAGTRNLSVFRGAEWTSEEIEKSLVELRLYAGIAMERLRPDWATRSFEKRLRDIWEEFPDDESDFHWDRTENQDNRLRLYNDLIGMEIDDYWFVDNCLRDISFLHLASATQKLERDRDQDLDNYLDASSFFNNLQFRKLKDYEEYERIRTKADEILTWIKSLLKDLEGAYWDEQ